MSEGTLTTAALEAVMFAAGDPMSMEDLADILKKAGFVDIKVSQHMQKHWLAVTGKHP